jgi:hypothetical protein
MHSSASFNTSVPAGLQTKVSVTSLSEVSLTKNPLLTKEGLSKIRKMVVLMKLLFEDDPVITWDNVYTVVERAYRSVDGEYGAEQARQSALDINGVPFSLAKEVGNGDLDRFTACDMDLVRMTREEHNFSAKNRLNKERVRNCVPEDHPDFAHVLELAKEGVHISTDESFIPGNPVPPFRNLYQIVAPAVGKMYHKEWLQKKCFILPTAVAMRIIRRWFASLHWTGKKDERKGRKLVDHADASSGHSLNGGTAKVQAQEQYGRITHPTIKQLAVMILGQVDKHGWDNVSLFQTDIKDAFGQLNIRAEDTRLLLSALTEDLTVIHHQGSFGLTHMPPAFAVISRIMES